jgi:hypothetical protein
MLGHVDVLQVHAGAHLVEYVDGFVGQKTVGDIAVAEATQALMASSEY